MTQVHKETLAAIENALPNRAGLDVEIFGMEGIPDDIAQAHQQRVIGQFAQAEAERRAITGNPAPGAAAGNGIKKPKIEGTSDLKKRLAEHKAKKAAEEAANMGSGNDTPNGGSYGEQSPGIYVSRFDTALGSKGTENFQGWFTRLWASTWPYERPSRKSRLSTIPSTIWSTASIPATTVAFSPATTTRLRLPRRPATVHW